jgi:hypothetical protein
MTNTRGLFTGILIFIFIFLLRGPEDAKGDRLSYITGLVLSASSGRPMPSLWVMIYEEDIVRGRSLTGDDGKFFIGSLNRKEYKLVIKRGKAALFEGKIRLPENEHYNIRVRE